MKMIFLIGIALFAYHSLLFPDGLDLNTPVKVKDGKRFIADIIKDRSKGKKAISFNVKKNKSGVRKVSGVGESLSNCYVCIQYSYKNEQNTDQILCTPQQEFYVLAKSDWVKAYELKKGDQLQAYDGFVEVVRVESKDEPLNVCMIEVSKDHTFFVGKYEVLTHNTVFPWEVAIGVSIAFGEGAAVGGAWGTSLGPIGITGGIIIGGLIGAGLNYFANSNKVHQYETFFDFGVLRDACAQNSYVIKDFYFDEENGGMWRKDSKKKDKEKKEEVKTPEKEKDKERKENELEWKEAKDKACEEGYEKIKGKQGKNRLKQKTKKSGYLDGKAAGLEWDGCHKDFEAYQKGGDHLGSIDPKTGQLYKGPKHPAADWMK